MTAVEQISAAIGAHGMWKTRLRTAVQTGKADVRPEVARDDHQCAFGKWLFGCDQASRLSKHHATCVTLHHRFHLAAADVLSLALAGKKQEAAKALEPGQSFSKVSAELTKAMQGWAAEQ